MPEPVVNLIAEAAEDLGVPYELALALAQTESGLDPYARGAGGQIGVFQIAPKYHSINAQRMGYDINTVAGNVYYGVHMLGNLIEREEGSINRALQRWNGGPLYKKKPDSKAYARTVMERVAKIQSGVAPVRHYSISSQFGTRTAPDTGVTEEHGGVDMASPIGTPVFASVSGKVSSVKHLKSSYGTHIRIKGHDGREYIYAHLSAERVEPGQQIRAGQRIGAVGASGHATGSHLHFEVRENGVAVDPMAWVTGEPPSATPDDPVGDFETEKQSFAELLAQAFQTDIETALAATDGLMGAMGISATVGMVEPGAEEEELGVPTMPQAPGEAPPETFDEPSGLAPYMSALAPMLGADEQGVEF